MGSLWQKRDAVNVLTVRGFLFGCQVRNEGLVILRQWGVRFTVRLGRLPPSVLSRCSPWGVNCFEFDQGATRNGSEVG